MTKLFTFFILVASLICTFSAIYNGCVPGEEWSESCNTCVCSKDASIDCEERSCISDECMPNSVWFDSDQRCHCGASGSRPHTICVKMEYQRGLQQMPCEPHSYVYDTCTWCMCNPLSNKTLCFSTGCTKSTGAPIAYPVEELVDMVFVYGLTDGNSLLALRLYEERYPNEHLSYHQIFARVYQRLQEKLSVEIKKRRERANVRPVDLEDAVLYRIEEDPTTSIRRIAAMENTSKSIIGRIFRLCVPGSENMENCFKCLCTRTRFRLCTFDTDCFSNIPKKGVCPQGHFPVYLKNTNALCLIIRKQECYTDYECSDKKKCCRVQDCYLRCVEPVKLKKHKKVKKIIEL